MHVIMLCEYCIFVLWRVAEFQYTVEQKESGPSAILSNKKNKREWNGQEITKYS